MSNIESDPSAFEKELGIKIRILRKEKNMTMEDLGQMIDMEETNVGRIERGETSVTLNSLRRICKALDTKLAVLFEGLSE